MWSFDIHSVLAVHGDSGFPLSWEMFSQLGRSIIVTVGHEITRRGLAALSEVKRGLFIL